MGYCDDHILVCIEILRIEFISGHCYLGPSCISIFFLHLHGLILDDAHLHFLACKDVLTIFDEFHLLIILALNLLPFESGELAQPHLHDCSCLSIREIEG